MFVIIEWTIRINEPQMLKQSLFYNSFLFPAFLGCTGSLCRPAFVIRNKLLEVCSNKLPNQQAMLLLPIFALIEKSSFSLIAISAIPKHKQICSCDRDIWERIVIACAFEVEKPCCRIHWGNWTSVHQWRGILFGKTTILWLQCEFATKISCD